ncbi:MAG: hypothetical protein KIT25_17035 [Enhydrobacter sp.]|nr:MAG: hypothetical protein KIT25_17035 [Enhydrobacter sp.]
MTPMEPYTHYRYSLLDPRNDAAVPAAVRVAAERCNAPLLGPRTLGIEVTVPALAARCGLGNVDPQHDGGADRRAAIDVCLERRLPPSGSFLVTIRPDPDALGSMAVLALRAHRGAVDTTVASRVARLSRADRFAHGPWPGPRPLPAAVDDFDGCREIAALAALAQDRVLALSGRVGGIAAWLLGGDAPPQYREWVDRRRRTVLRRLRAGEDRYEVKADGRMVVLQGGGVGALQLGYRLAPVVIAESLAFGEPPHRKLSVAQYDASHADLAAAAAELAAREPGWGGSATIIGSPQGRRAELPLAQVEAVVMACLK